MNLIIIKYNCHNTENYKTILFKYYCNNYNNTIIVITLRKIVLSQYNVIDDFVEHLTKLGKTHKCYHKDFCLAVSTWTCAKPSSHFITTYSLRYNVTNTDDYSNIKT